MATVEPRFVVCNCKSVAFHHYRMRGAQWAEALGHGVDRGRRGHGRAQLLTPAPTEPEEGWHWPLVLWPGAAYEPAFAPHKSEFRRSR
jgi:hypothetical protein